MSHLINQHDIGFSIWKNDLGICLTSVASTKSAEFLSCGKPVIVNSQQGDLGSIVSERNVGVVTEDANTQSIKVYAQQILSTVQDPKLSVRCRETALDYFDLENGIEKLLALYDSFDS
jgi:glycosyltransferase involved in cell wall biosynthesis